MCASYTLSPPSLPISDDDHSTEVVGDISEEDDDKDYVS